MSESKYAKWTIVLLAVWFLYALSASALRAFQGPPDRPPLALLLSAVVPLLLFFLSFRLSAGFREFVLSLDPQILVIIQTWRIGGMTFVTLYTLGLLPGIFALPAGLGDFAIGVTAPFVTWTLARPAHRKGFVRWNVLGITDLVLAITLGSLARFLSPHGVTTSLMTQLPLSMIPTFLVPFFLILHSISIAQARAWAVQSSAQLDGRLASSAA